METLPYAEKSILVLGGSGVNSIGRTAVHRFNELGARAVFIGSTSETNFDNVIEACQRKGFPTDRLHPFVADVTDRESLAKAAKMAKAQGHGLTDVVFAHAGGMDGFLPRLIESYLNPIRTLTRGRSMYSVDETIQAQVRAIMVPMLEQIRVWRDESIPKGIAVNFDGTFKARDILRDEFPDGFTGVFINSTWGHLSGTPGVEIPLLYGPVDVSKAKVRDRVREEAEQYYAEKTPMAILVASLVRRTRVGKMFQDYLMLISDPEQAAAIKNTSVNPEDVVEGIMAIMEDNLIAWTNHQLELFVTGENGKAVYRDHLEMSAMYSTPYPY